MAVSSLTHLAKVMVTKTITFMERWEREDVAKSSKSGFVRVERTRLRSHEDVGLSTGRKVLSKRW